MDRRQIVHRVRELVEPAARAVGCELLDVELVGSESHPILRLTLDREAGVSVADCAEVSRRVNPLLDVEDVIAGTYHLEVSSPGLNRPLKRIEDFERYRDRRVKIEIARALGPERNQKRFQGTLRGVRNGEIELDDEGSGRVSIPFRAIQRAHLVYEISEQDFGNRSDPGRAKNGTRGKRNARAARPTDPTVTPRGEKPG